MIVRKFENVSYNNTGRIPTRADDGSAGYDFYTNEKIVIPPKTAVTFSTNIKVSMRKDEVLMLYIRSSVGIKKNIMLSNGTGVIDSTYYNNPDNEGNIMCALYNYGDKEQVIEAGDRVMQGVFVKYLTTDNDIVINKKRTGGIGSSGK